MKDTRKTQSATPTSSECSNGPTWSATLVDLYTNQFDRLVTFAQRVLCDRSLAEECVQEAFMNYHVKGVSPMPGCELGYLRTMVRNGAVSMVRSECRGREVADQLPEVLAAPSAELVALAHFAVQDLTTKVSQLAPRQVEVVELRLAGMSVAETAQHLSVADGTVKTHRHRAAEALRSSFDLAVAA